uniref:Uncharacterized protein n=1 Tax=Oryza brachyantha TaxID=4533 RepID=J3LPM2_ORYBR
MTFFWLLVGFGSVCICLSYSKRWPLAASHFVTSGAMMQTRTMGGDVICHTS